MFTFPLLLTIYAGFIHAFEADHLLAVSNIVSQRNNVKLSLKDGIFWGLGHTSTIFLVGY
jgi:high-affinity nickel permease